MSPESVTITVTLSGNELTQDDLERIAAGVSDTTRRIEAEALAQVREVVGDDAVTGETRASWRLLDDDSLEFTVAVRLVPGAVWVDEE